MNGIRKLLLYITAIALVALALPGNAAPQKRFSLTMSMSTTTTATFNNLSNGNSYINSMNLTTPLPVTHVEVQANLITSTTSVTPNCTTAQPCAAGTTILISNISGVAPGTSGTLTLTVSAPADQNACSTSYTWSAMAFTGNAGNSGGGTSFLTPDGSTTATSTTSIACVLQFVNQPANAQVGSTITSVVNDPSAAPVKVQALIGGSSAANFTGQITLTQSPATGALAGGSANASAGTAVFNSLSLDTLGTYTLTATATGFTSATSSPFKIFAGELNCTEPFPTSIINPGNVAPDQPGYAFGNRNGSNKDGVTDGDCKPVLYTFTNNILASADPLLSNTVNLSWDTQSQVNAAFQYTVNWQPVAVDSPASGWSTSPRPQVAWLDMSGNLATGATPSANIAWTPGLACVSSSLPVSYGTLAADLGTTVDANNTSTITINGIAAVPAQLNPANQPYSVPAAGSPDIPAVPFPVVIAGGIAGQQSTLTERMTAIAMVGSPVPNGNTFNITYQVRRGTVTEGSPTAQGVSTIESHGAGLSVMSTPLPIIPNNATVFKAPYKVNTQAQMCIAKHGFTSFTIDAHGNTQVMYTTTIFDIGDGWVLGR
ncbi:MAG TPA: hypothetical protein VFO53_15145 [Casimicrobiaceae bacterium]|nr:hypothetical protein [Casimicrobiaceae bacterium]